MALALEEVLVDLHHGKDLSSNEFFVNVIVITVESKSTSNLLTFLADQMPLSHHGLAHLKRVRKKERTSPYVEIVVCPIDHLTNLTNGFWTSCGIVLSSDHPDILQHPNISIHPVPRYEPQNRNEFTIWCQTWPINFHPGEDERSRSKGHSEEEKEYVHNMLRTLLSLSDESTKDIALLANPINKLSICNSEEAWMRLEEEFGNNVYRHPLYSAPFICIDQLSTIAKTKTIESGM
jgi:hypothetical protein